MKRYKLLLIVFVILALVICVSTPTSAQQVDKVDTRTIDFANPYPVTEIVSALCKDAGYEVTYDDQIPTTATWKGKLEVVSLAAMLKAVLEPSGFEASPVGWTMHIRKIGRPYSPTNTTPAETVKKQSGGFGSGRMIRALSRSIVEVPTVTGPVPAPPPESAPVTNMNPAPVVMTGFGSGNMIGMRSRYYDPYWMEYTRRFKNAEAWGRLKVKSPPPNAHVFVDGHPLAPASKTDNWGDEGLAIPAGPHDVQLMWLDREEIKVLSWRAYEVRPMMVQRVCWVGGDKKIYERAPRATPEEEATYREALGLTVGTMK